MSQATPPGGRAGGTASRHLTPFFCPYCGDEAIRPYGEKHGEWQCESCRRAFALRSVTQSERVEAKK